MLLRTLLIALLALPLAARAQEATKKAPDKPVYKLDYVITELDSGKKTDTHNYTVLSTEDRQARLRVGIRVPVVTGNAQNVQYLDVGVNVDAGLREVSDTVLDVRTVLDVSSLVLPATEAEKSRSGNNPVIRNMRTEDATILTLGKPTLLFSLDEPNSKRSFQVSLTASRVH